MTMYQATSYLAGLSGLPPADGHNTEAPLFQGVSETGAAVPGASVLPASHITGNFIPDSGLAGKLEKPLMTGVQYLGLALLAIVLIGIGAFVLTGTNPVKAVGA